MKRVVMPDALPKKMFSRRWTTSAMDCYARGCDCTRCPVRSIIEERCRMKDVVKGYILREYPPPKELAERFGIKE